jgi:hypothetical protein
MPNVSSFYGITITMFFDESIHSGRPHFHAEYAGAAASFEIGSLDCLVGVLPPRVERMVKKWASIHSAELAANWNRARDHQQLKPIDPFP